MNYLGVEILAADSVGELLRVNETGALDVSEVLSKINMCKQDIALNDPNIKQVSINLESNYKGNGSELSLL